MKTKLALKFAIRNLKANRLLEIPFLISGSLMMAMFYIMVSLSQNKFVMTRHITLPIAINFGMVLVGIFALVFMIYANAFLVKRRNKEFALYGILGLEKKHISKILFFEYIINYFIILLFGISGGFVFGKVNFLFLNKLLGNINVSIMEYPFSVVGAVFTLFMIFLSLVLTYFRTIINIGKSTPVELLSKQRKNEGEPKSKIVLTFIGAILLGAGYYIALTREGTLSAIMYFFGAVLLVIFGTYLLFMSLSIVVLKLLKSKRNFYYKDVNFITISGMLYRMKTNAISLASIAILSTSVIVALTLTTSIFSGINDVVDSVAPSEYKITTNVEMNLDSMKYSADEYRKNTEREINKNLKDGERVLNNNLRVTFAEQVYIKDNMSVEPLGNLRRMADYAFMESLESYNEFHNTNISLKDDEVIIAKNREKLNFGDKFIFAGKEYNVIYAEDDIPKNMGIESFRIVVKDYTVLKNFVEYYGNVVDNVYEAEFNYNFDVEGEQKDFSDRFKKVFTVSHGDENRANIVDFTSKKEISDFIYDVNGGFIFLGIIISVIFVIGSVLITYYKQISEGYDDRKNYQILKQVGLPDELIKKSLKIQILNIFFLPLVVSAIHFGFASKILFQLLGLFGVTNIALYLRNAGIVFLIFAIFYYVIYKITSRIYYKIVS